MKTFKFALFVFGLIIGISLNVVPVQQKPAGAEKEIIKPNDDQEFLEVEEITINVITDLIKEGPREKSDSVTGGNHDGIDVGRGN